MEPDDLSGQSFTPSLHAEDLTLDDAVSELEDLDEVDEIEEAQLGPFQPFDGSDVPVPMAGIDVGVVDLGISRTGFALAFKGCVVSQALDGTHSVFKVGPRVKFITPSNRADILRFVGRELGDEFMFVAEQEGGDLTIKAGAREPNQYKDRIRNYIERMLQLDVVRSLRNGIMLVDGALTLRTYNTPQAFMERLAREARRTNSDIVGISKKSRVTVGGVHISALLDDSPPQPGFCQIIAEDTEGEDTAVSGRNLGNLYAARFSPGGFTFRVDVARQSVFPSDPDVLQALFANTHMTLGYPNLLRLSHIHSAFTKSEIVSLQVAAAHEYGVSMRPPEDLSVIFAPFRKGIGG